MKRPYNQEPKANYLSRLGLQYLNFDVLKRAIILSLVIGTILNVTNHYSFFWEGELPKKWPIVQMFLTPFLVITFSQLLAIQYWVNTSRSMDKRIHNESFLMLLIGHKILLRSLFLAIFICLTNSILASIVSLNNVGDLGQVKLLTLFQFFILPFLFGAISQTLTLRRHVENAAAHEIKPI